MIVGASGVDDARTEAARLDPEYLATSTTPRRGRAIEACHYCHRWEPILAGTYTRVDFRGDIGIRLLCDDCGAKADDRYASWQDTEVEVV